MGHARRRQEHGSRLYLLDGRAASRSSFRYRKCARLAKGLDQISRPPFGDDHDRTHVAMTTCNLQRAMSALRLGIRR